MVTAQHPMLGRGGGGAALRAADHGRMQRAAPKTPEQRGQRHRWNVRAASPLDLSRASATHVEPGARRSPEDRKMSLSPRVAPGAQRQERRKIWLIDFYRKFEPSWSEDRVSQKVKRQLDVYGDSEQRFEDLRA
eukprot:COSAG02_NODE_2607_length_8436_cov_3.451841_14_plen_133_part_01